MATDVRIVQVRLFGLDLNGLHPGRDSWKADFISSDRNIVRSALTSPAHLRDGIYGQTSSIVLNPLFDDEGEKVFDFEDTQYIDAFVQFVAPDFTDYQRERALGVLKSVNRLSREVPGLVPPVFVSYLPPIRSRSNRINEYVLAAVQADIKPLIIPYNPSGRFKRIPVKNLQIYDLIVESHNVRNELLPEFGELHGTYPLELKPK